MNLKRALFPILLLSLMLAACSSDPSLTMSTYVPPFPPTQKAIVQVATATAVEAKLAAPCKFLLFDRRTMAAPAIISFTSERQTRRQTNVSVIIRFSLTTTFQRLPTGRKILDRRCEGTPEAAVPSK